ncbi:hypothetical protein BJ742DRAFT_909489 [Cladochytrium replicatum]|nr:hypothetical protein BJ742DRAFT_909489 [Cladochytrium replicatum]
MDWDTVAKTRADVGENAFWAAIDIWTAEPNIVVKHIRRAEITSDISISDTFSSIPNLPTWAPPTAFRWVRRKLIPVQTQKDRVLDQDIFYVRDELSGECRALHVPLNDARTGEEADPNQLPYYMPKVAQIAYVYLPRTDQEPNLSIQLLPFDSVPIPNDSRSTKIFTAQIHHLQKFALGTQNGYKKRVHHDLVVPKIDFQNLYDDLKSRHSQKWIETWPESTDPKKHVFEDIAIAAFLISLWRMEEEEGSNGSGGKKKFVDVGCGNGLLVHLLTEEGYDGYGIDIAKRATWDMVGANAVLREEVIDPRTTTFEDVQWIIGNHPDELTLWIPLIAARSGYDTKLIIIPCCFHELSGAKFTSWHLHPTTADHAAAAGGRYAHYVSIVSAFASQTCSFRVENENLRIPSTKNVAIVCRERLHAAEGDEEVVRKVEAVVEGVVFVPRVTDREKTRRRMERLENRKGSQAR